MSQSRKVIKNSFYLIIQPLILNFIAIFSVGYIARTLGNNDYGNFIFTFSFIQIFSPIYMAGLSTYSIRMMAENKTDAANIVGKLFVLRALLGLLAILIAVITISLLRYSEMVRMFVYLYSITLLSSAVVLTSTDLFQAFEKMEYVAYVNLISGLCIIFFSVFVLFIGYHVTAVIVVYLLGNILAMALGIRVIYKNFFRPKLVFDPVFIKSSLTRGIHFFYPNVAYILGSRMGFVFLSKLAGGISVGIYAASDNLVSRLTVIGDATCSSIYPSLVSSYKKSHEEAVRLFRKFFAYLLILSSAIVTGCILLSDEIILLIYGHGYAKASVVLRVAIVGLVIMILNSLMAFALATLHKEKYSAFVQALVNILTLIASFFLIVLYKEVGFAAALLLGALVLFVANIVMIKKYLCSFLIERNSLLKIMLANFIMSAAIILLRGLGPIIIMILCPFLYLGALLYLKVFNINEFIQLVKVIGKRKGFSDNMEGKLK